MKFKVGVNLNGIKPPMLRAMASIEEVYLRVAKTEPTMTSALDSHSEGLHPKGLAGDFRIRDVDKTLWTKLREQIDSTLNPRVHAVKLYDVILELQKPGSEHIHVEYDPKTRKET